MVVNMVDTITCGIIIISSSIYNLYIYVCLIIELYPPKKKGRKFLLLLFGRDGLRFI